MAKIQKEVEKRHLLRRQEKWIVMSPKEVKLLFGYYVFILIISFAWVAFSVLYHFEHSVYGFSRYIGIFMFALPSGILGASIYYIRKLYKSCIQTLFAKDEVDDKSLYYRKIGAKMYFYIRPIVSGIFAVMLNIAILAGINIMNADISSGNNNFEFLIILLSFYVGFCNGKIIVYMDDKKDVAFNKIFRKSGE